MMGSVIGRGNQYKQLFKVLHCKLPTNSKQLPAFHLRSGQEPNPDLLGGRREFYHSPWPPEEFYHSPWPPEGGE